MLLVEYNVLEKVKIINEGTKGRTKVRLQGKFQKCDEQNNNGRIYPKSILESQVKAIQEKIGDRSLVGALDHPTNDAIHLSQASHLITKLWVEKNGDVMGECEILSTPNGKIVEALLNDGVKLGISSRGIGSVTEGIKGKLVNEDFKLITFDLVSDPSTRGAFPQISESMRENSERAQKIISKHKKDRVLLTMLESKIREALHEAGTPEVERRNLKQTYGKKRSGDYSNASRWTKEDETEAAGQRKYDADKANLKQKKKAAIKEAKKKVAKKKASPTVTITGHGGEVATDANPLTVDGRTEGQADTQQHRYGKKKKRPFIPIAGSVHGPGEKPITPAEQRKAEKRARRAGGLPDSTEIIGNALIEGFKKVCWGSPIEEGSIKNDPDAFEKAKKLANAKKTPAQLDVERREKLQKAIAANEKRRIAGGGAGVDQSKRAKK
tara:strand:- start:11352 stop:12668 length:1317 start_codon:yes stop_codon:yes gene_type:complete